MIEKIIKENTKYEKGKVSTSNVLKSSLNRSGKDENDYIKSVTKKMKEYLKDGSKGDYEMNPKHFPKGNGELEEMEKMAFSLTDDNEDFNYGAQLLTYALQPTIASNTNMFAFLSAMAGDSYTTEDSFGTKAYEKIANFVANTQDIHTSNVDYIYSLANSIDSEFDSYNLTPPPTLKRAFDLFSVPHNRLWGTREKYNINFNNQSDHTNLGTSLTAYNINTAIVSSGQLIVLNDLFVSNFYELLEVPRVNSYASVTALDPNNTYFTSSLTYPVTSYPLSAFFGWGVKTPVANYYRFWVYKPGFNNIPVNNTIDWSTKTDGVSTTLVESNSSVSEWYKDSGILENIYSYYLYKGLDLLK